MKHKLKHLLHTSHPQHETLAFAMLGIGLILICNDYYFFWSPFAVGFLNDVVQNGPYKSNNRHSVFLKITNLDGQTQYQTVYEGDNLYGRKLYNGSGQWHKYTNTPI